MKHNVRVVLDAVIDDEATGNDRVTIVGVTPETAEAWVYRVSGDIATVNLRVKANPDNSDQRP